ncbi:M61 family metallopeptidase [Spirulina sp. CS-785/01]|uniref:M61 family metallopeptidase n=1 Tax=Spirulina sp. CS-785/01 TaxID=3021716 RepID=UPI00232C2739|nr:M61 family metallopeptidase [Spirulina sp. CS-785/01]MDB9315051.1 M61 family metallopeptidase [Spirulina sp. CS-785/01]
MTKATIASDRKSNPITTPTLEYTVAMPHPASHLFEVTLHIKSWQRSLLNLKMPVWTPGSYLVREYAKQVQDFQATPPDQTPLSSQKINKNHWQIDTHNHSEITVFYRVYANELTVRTNHLDSTHGYFNGAALFCYIPGLENQPLQITLQPPHPDWTIATALPPHPDKTNTFVAPDFDTLVDSPVEIGLHETHQFTVLGKKHRWTTWGSGNIDPQQVIKDTAKIIETEAKIYGGLPYQEYLFLLHLASNGFGGLEHKTSCSLIYSRFGFRNPSKYNRFMQLVAHEFFHLWNVKRIRPKALEVFDYDQENYTTSLWFCEGVTSYYDTLIPHWSGIYNRKTFLEILSKDINRYFNTPGRKVQPLTESSFDAWIKLYRRDANSDNSQISYYLKGEMVSLLLDLLIRKRHNNQRSLNTVMKQMWEQFGQEEIGYTPRQLKELLEAVAGMDLSDFFARYLDGLEDLPLNEYLEPFGLRIKAVQDKRQPPYLGIRFTSQNPVTAQFVEANSPAGQAGIDAGDELLALDGVRLTAEDFNERLQDYEAGDTVELTIFHQDELQTHTLQLATPQPSGYQLVMVEKPTEKQKQLLNGWLGKEG